MSRLPVAALADGELDGVTVARHPLELETERAMRLAKRVGARLSNWLSRMPQECVQIQITDQGPIPVLDKDGNHVMGPLLPDKCFVENAKWYSNTVLGLLKEQRERAKLAAKHGAQPQLTDAQIDAELMDILRSMPSEELHRLLAASQAIDLPGTMVSEETSGLTSDPSPTGHETVPGTFPWNVDEDEEI